MVLSLQNYPFRSSEKGLRLKHKAQDGSRQQHRKYQINSNKQRPKWRNRALTPHPQCQYGPLDPASQPQTILSYRRGGKQCIQGRKGRIGTSVRSINQRTNQQNNQPTKPKNFVFNPRNSQKFRAARRCITVAQQNPENNKAPTDRGFACAVQRTITPE